MIGNEFNKLRESNRALAYRTKQKRINEYFGILSELVSPKDLMEEARRCEEFMGGEGSGQGLSALDELANFLNDKPDKPEKRVH